MRNDEREGEKSRMIIMIKVFTVGWDWHEDKCSDDTHCKKLLVFGDGKIIKFFYSAYSNHEQCPSS